MLSDVKKTSDASVALAACVALAAGLSGCGSSATPADGGGRGGGGGSASGTGTLSWQDDGVAHQTAFASAALVTSSGIQLLQVAGGEASGIGLAFGVSGMPTIGVGTYQCGPSAGGGYPITSFSYTAPGVDPLYQSCTVSITALGAVAGEHASGTFSAVLTKSAGGTEAITAGVFNVPLTVSQ